MYYQHNIPTTGVDVRVRGRVVLTQQLENVWSDIHRGPDYNWFTGELVLDDNFRTVNNKTALDANNPFWQGLLQELSKVDPNSGKAKFKPHRRKGKATEDEIRRKLAAALRSSVSGSTVKENYPVWSGAGVKADIHLKTSDRVEVYEVKASTAQPLDLYQLLMYWDGVVNDTKVSPKLGRLVAPDVQSSVLTMIESINKRTDGLGNNYNLEFKKTTDWKIT